MSETAKLIGNDHEMGVVPGYFWHFKSANNEIVCASQVYKTKESAIHGAYVIKNNAASSQVLDYTGEK